MKGKHFFVFDPVTGQHVKSDTVAEARVAMKVAVQALLDAVPMSMVEVTVNDDDSETWEAVDVTGFVDAPQVTIPANPPKRGPIDPGLPDEVAP